MQIYSPSLDWSRIVLVSDVRVLEAEEYWENRAKCTIETFSNILASWMNAIIVDGWSTHKAFIKERDELKERGLNIIIPQKGKFKTYGEQIRYTLKTALDMYTADDALFYRFEPEKSELITPENLKLLLSFIKNNPLFEYITLMRKRALNMPESQYITENIAAILINSFIEILGWNDFSLGNTSDLEEGVATFFGPFVSTRSGVERILSLSPQSDRDGNELFFVARLRSYLESLTEQESKALFFAVDFHYDMECELLPELQEYEYIKENKITIKQHAEMHPSSLVYKRSTSLQYIMKAMYQEIKRYQDSLDQKAHTSKRKMA